MEYRIVRRPEYKEPRFGEQESATDGPRWRFVDLQQTSGPAGDDLDYQRPRRTPFHSPVDTCILQREHARLIGHQYDLATGAVDAFPLQRLQAGLINIAKCAE